MNGPALAVRGARLAVAWFTEGKDAQPTVKLMTSDDGGKSFSPPRVVDAGTPLGRVDVTILADGSCLVLWVAKQGKRGLIRVNRHASDGEASVAVTVATITSRRGSGFPRIEALEQTALVAWTGDDRQVHTSIVDWK